MLSMRTTLPMQSTGFSLYLKHPEEHRTMFDPKCYELAEHFLPHDASEKRKNELAQDIQDHVELMLFQPATVGGVSFGPGQYEGDDDCAPQ
jgi:hypothetical protein